MRLCVCVTPIGCPGIPHMFVQPSSQCLHLCQRATVLWRSRHSRSVHRVLGRREVQARAGHCFTIRYDG